MSSKHNDAYADIADVNADSNNVIKDASINVTGKFSYLNFNDIDSITNTSIYAHSSSSSIPG